MDQADKINIINYRIEQAHKTINEVDVLLKNNLLTIAVNRIYYGMFYMILALALKHEFKTSKHQQLIGWFNKSFIKTDKIDKKYGQFINDAFENRSDADYGLFTDFNKVDVNKMFTEMKDLIKTIESYLNV